eukprot:473164-Rhodomonas_salina.1
MSGLEDAHSHSDGCMNRKKHVDTHSHSYVDLRRYSNGTAAEAGMRLTEQQHRLRARGRNSL